MTDQEKLSVATDALKEAEVLARQPVLPFEARFKLGEIHALLSRKLAALGIVVAPAQTPDVAKGIPFEATRITVDPDHSALPMIEFTRQDGVVGWLRMIGTELLSIEQGKRYQITITEAP
jgi:hypothetical protein